MKKLLILMLALLLVFSLAACDSGDNPDPSGTNNNDPLNRDPGTTQSGNQGNNPTDVDIGSILAGNGETDIIWANQDEATKQTLIDAAKEEGFTVTFGTDGSTTLTDEEGNKHIQKADGTWSYTGKDGASVNIGGNWPNNELTKLIPAATFNISSSTYYDGNCAISFSGATLDGIKSYVEQVKSAGFDNDVKLSDSNNYYSYEAYDDNGNYLQLFFTAGVSGLTMKAADPDENGGDDASHELFDIEELRNATNVPTYAKKAIGTLDYCNDKSHMHLDSAAYYVVAMENVTSADYDVFIANLTTNGGQKSNSYDLEVYSWDWGEIYVSYDSKYKTLYVEIDVAKEGSTPPTTQETIPLPSNNYTIIESSEYKTEYMFASITAAQVQEYINTLKEYGFTQNENVTGDLAGGNAEYYIFMATHSTNNRTVMVLYTGGAMTVSVTNV